MSSVEIAQSPQSVTVNSSPSVTVVADFEDDSSMSGNSENEAVKKLDKKISSDSEANQAKDSGIECNLDHFVPPDEETSAKILQTVEYYFSDANILKDPFLLKHVRRNKEGYVSLKLISSFRKVRCMCRNWKAVAHSIQTSSKLALNSDGTKVRRLDPLPDHDETIHSRTVIVYGFQNDKITIETVSEMFSKCGDIAVLRILRSGSSFPVDVKKYIAKNPEMQSKNCVVVEFEELSGAKNALAMNCEKENGIRVISVVPKEKEKKEPRCPAAKSELQSTSPEQSPKKKKKNKRAINTSSQKINEAGLENSTKNTHRRKYYINDSLGYSSSGSYSSGYLSSSPGNCSGSDWFNRRHSFNPGMYADCPPSFASLSNRNCFRKDRFNVEKTNAANQPDSLSPWRRRREQSLISEIALYNSSTATTPPMNRSLPVKTLRLPKGPDGTRGFGARMKTSLPTTTENC